jgi:phenylalanyl-tRNA synthetase beta chain
VYGFELDLSSLQEYSDQGRLLKAFSKYPFIEKDVAFIVDRDLSAGELERAIISAGRPLVISVEIFDLYQGDQLTGNKKSVAFRMRFQSQDRTLSDKEVNALFEKIIGFVQKKYQATLRDE